MKGIESPMNPDYAITQRMIEQRSEPNSYELKTMAEGR